MAGSQRRAAPRRRRALQLDHQTANFCPKTWSASPDRGKGDLGQAGDVSSIVREDLIALSPPERDLIRAAYTVSDLGCGLLF